MGEAAHGLERVRILFLGSGSKGPSPWISLSALTLTTGIWGYSFLLVHDAVACYPVYLFLALRFTLATLLVAPFLLSRLHKLDRHTVLGGFFMGTALFGGYAFQSFGLVWTSAAHSGFITGLFVVLTPVFHALISRRPPRADVWLAVILATLGLGLLSLGSGFSRVNPGDVLSLICAAVYAIHLLLTGHMARRYDTAALVLVQLATVALLSWLFSIPSAGKLLPVPYPAVVAIVITALFASAFAYFVQTAFQRYTSAIQTAIIFTMEPVFAGFFAVLVGGEVLGWRGLAGGGLIVAGMFLGQMAENRALKRVQAAAMTS